MVNGPRPTKLTTPSASPNGPATNGTTPARSPLFLQRQTTSVYSTVTSTGTPVLVYGKAATPLAGAWSAEPWNPEQVAAAPMPDALEDPRQQQHDTATSDDVAVDHNDNDDMSSVAETAAFTENSYARSPVQASAPAMPATTTAVTAASPSKHVAFKYRFDPYAPAGGVRRETFRCDCDECVDAGVLGNDRLIGAHYDAAGYYANDGEASGGAFDRFATSETGAFNDDATSAAGMSWGATAEMDAAAVVPEVLATSFIPPPPPPRIARSIIAESAEGSLDADAAFYHIAMRWYTKVAAVQAKHVATEDDWCPKPSEDSDFDEWVHAAGRWWLRHFEHAQVKSTPSSGLLRTAPAPANARPAAGFETHTNVSESFANHRHALRSGPRKTFGSSNLNASMLANLGGGGSSKQSALPAPRSSASRLEQLPW